MIGTIAVTDEGWYRFLAQHPEVEEVNFWTPSARRGFRADPFSPFLFKLRAPHNAICGFAHFAQYSRLPLWLAWECFGIGNGCASHAEMNARIEGLRAGIRYREETGSEDIGCIQLVSPVFFPREAWIPQPADWHPRTQSSERYELTAGEGRRVWDACLSIVASMERRPSTAAALVAGEPEPRYGVPRLMQPRLGQATFRIAVMDAYGRACAATGEHSLPALEAAHIQPFADAGPHAVPNGLLLRADLHRLFDRGYITVTRELRLEIGGRLKDEFHNGRSYYPLHGTRVRPPASVRLHPAGEFITWHNERVFRG